MAHPRAHHLSTSPHPERSDTHPQCSSTLLFYTPGRGQTPMKAPPPRACSQPLPRPYFPSQLVSSSSGPPRGQDPFALRAEGGAGLEARGLQQVQLLPSCFAPSRHLRVGKGKPRGLSGRAGAGGWAAALRHIGSPALTSAIGTQGRCSLHTYSVPGAPAPARFRPHRSPGWQHHDIVTKTRTIWRSSEVPGLRGRLSGRSSTPRERSLQAMIPWRQTVGTPSHIYVRGLESSRP